MSPLPPNQFLKTLRPEDEVDAGGATPAVARPDGLTQMRSQGQIGRGGEAIARAVGGALDGLHSRREAFFERRAAINPMGAQTSAKPSPVASLPAQPARNAATAPVARPSVPSVSPAAGSPPVAPRPPGGSADPSRFTNSLGRPAVAPPGVAVTKDAPGRPVFTASRESVAAAGGLASSPSVAQAMPALPNAPVPRPVFGGSAVGASIGIPGEAERKQEIALSGAMFPTARSRGDRAVQAQMVQGIYDQAGQRAALEAEANQAQLEASTNTNLAQMGQVGANYRAEIQQGGETARSAAKEAGDDRRLQASQSFDLKRPTQVVDAEGNALSVSGTLARPIMGANGEPVRMPIPGGTLAPKDILDAYGEELANMPIGVDPGEYRAQIDASPIGQVRAELLRPLRPDEQRKPSAADVRLLLDRKGTPAQFDAVFGAGAAARYLREAGK